MFFSGNSKAKSDTPGIVVKNFSLRYCIHMGIVLFYFQKVGQDGHSIPPYKRFILPCRLIPCQGDFFISAGFYIKKLSDRTGLLKIVPRRGKSNCRACFCA